MPTNIDDKALTRLEELAVKASNGPWSVDNAARSLWVGDGDERCEDVANAKTPFHVVDLHYIAAACNAVPALVAEVRRLRAELDAYIDEDQTKVIILQHQIMDVLRDKLEAWEWYDEVCSYTIEKEHPLIPYPWRESTLERDEIIFHNACSEYDNILMCAREDVHADRE